MFGNDNPTPGDVRTAMQTLRDLGVASVQVEFSGGNDEGGVDSIHYFDAAGARIDSVGSSNAQERRYYSGGKEHNEGWKVYDRTLSDDFRHQYRDATDEEIRLAKIAKVLESPVYERYHTFAGEFYVDGTVEWDVAAGTHKMKGQESVQTWEEFEI